MSSSCSAITAAGRLSPCAERISLIACLVRFLSSIR
jgi:hypothetical protein